MSERNKLKELILKHALKRGDFILASGKRSSYYIDMREVTLHPEGIYLVGRIMFQMIEEKRRNGLAIEAVGGVTLGGDPIVSSTAVISYLEKKPLIPFIIRKEPKSHGTGQWIEGMGNLRKDMIAVILEDVVTTGGSSLKAVKISREHGLDVKGVFAVVDREEGGRGEIEKEGIFFQPIFSIKELL
jgi:orotate phosphoribosyltransferase